MRRAIACMFIVLSAHLCGSDDVKLVRKAEAYYEAKDYEKAKELFEQISGEKLAPWQQGRLLFNLATISLEQGEWDNALEIYSEVSRLPGSTPYLERALHTNLAILKYRNGSEILSGQDLGLEQYEKAIFLFRGALQNLDEAQVEACRLAALMGRSECDWAEDLAQLRSAVKSDLASSLQKYGREKIAESPVKAGVPLLLVGVNSALSSLDFLEENPLDGTMKSKYLNHFVRDAESWLPLWEAQLARMEEVEEAYEHYQKGLQHMRSEEIEESRLAFLGSDAALNELIQQLWGMDPLVKLLQNLLAEYERAFVQVPIQIPTIYQIEAQQKRVEDVSITEEADRELILESRKFLGVSLDYAREAKHPDARFFLHSAMHRVRLLLRQKVDSKKTPEEILENAIEDQGHALTLHRLSRIREGAREYEEDFLAGSQQRALETAGPFYEAVLKKEKNEYPSKCQCRPWDKVVPLFEKGLQAAEKSMDLLREKSRMTLAMSEQEQALRYWKEALEHLRHPEKDEEKRPEEQPEEKEKEQPEPQPEKGPSIDEVLRRLQNMAQDDRRPKPSQKPPQRGLRPW